MSQKAVVDWMDFQRHGGIVEITVEDFGPNGEIVLVKGHLPGGASILSESIDVLRFDCSHYRQQTLALMLKDMGCTVHID